MADTPIFGSSEGTELKKRKSAPILFYNNGVSSFNNHPIVIDFLGVTSSLSHSHIIGNTNDEILSQVTESINFGAELGPLHDASLIEPSLFKNYWEDWITDIYDLKQRKVRVKGVLPAEIISKLSLDDRIVIGTNRYKINDFKVDLTTGETTLNLFNDIFETEDVNTNVVALNQDIVSPSSPDIITCNAGKKYYSISVKNIPEDMYWNAWKIPLQDGDDWIVFDNHEGYGPGEIVFYFEEFVSQSATHPRTDRDLIIRVDVWTDESTFVSYTTHLYQNPIITT